MTAYGTRSLKKGDSGLDVKEAQVRLAFFGSKDHPIKCTETFDDDFEMGVKKFQRIFNLPENGIVDHSVFQNIEDLISNNLSEMDQIFERSMCKCQRRSAADQEQMVRIWNAKIAGVCRKIDGSFASAITTSGSGSNFRIVSGAECKGFGSQLTKVALTSANSWNFSGYSEITENAGLHRALCWALFMMLQVMKKNKEGAAVSIDIGRSHNGYRCNLDYFQVCKNATQGASMTNHTGNAVDIHIDSTAELSFEFSTLKIPLRNSASSSSKQAHCLALIDWLEEFGFATGDRVRVQGVNPKAFKTGATNTLRTEGFAKTGTWTHIDATTYAYKAYVTNAADLFAPRYTAGQATTPTVPPSAVQEKAPPQNTAPPAQPAPKSQPAKPAASTASTPSPKDLLKNAEDSKKWFETNWTSFFDAYRDAATADANDGIHTDRGFFPVGQNLTWHGGIHAQAQTDGSIHAMTDGVIVAARLSDKDPAKLSYGSRNFVLIKHTTPKSLPFWSLYMHLRPLPLKPETPELGALFPWLVKQTLKQIGTESSNFRGSPAANAPILRTIEPGETFAVLDQKMVGTQKWIKAKADKDKLDGWVAMTSRFELKSEIDKLQDLKAGKVVKLDKPVKRNDCIGFVSPALPGRSAFVHWEVFSDQVVSDQWIQVKDEDNDIVCDAEEFKKLLNKSEAINFMNELTKADIIAAYSDAKTSAEIRKRTFFFTSEWSVDWNTALDKRKDVYDPKELAPRLLPYNFWKDAEAAGCDVPKGGKIWHYHPAEFILREFPVAKAAPANSESAPDASQDEFDIDWDFIAAREGTELKVYVPTKNGTVIGVSGPTIASGFDLGQTTLTAFLEYGFSSGIQESLKKFIGIKGQPAVAFVENNPCTLTAEQIREINHKVKPAYARKTEKYYNQSVLAGGTTFKQLPRHVQTPFVSVCFQYGKADTLKSKLLQKDWVGAVDTLLHFTSKTEEVKKKGTNVSTPVMQYLTRRVKEARYLADGLTDPEQQQRARALIKAREDEWLAARGEAIK